ncbi:hypothetical protein BHM03_00042552 [Ensete ventricosum]|nr:hypothetical protein BHM03_00042552 [Ensete ventricosum]
MDREGEPGIAAHARYFSPSSAYPSSSSFSLTQLPTVDFDGVPINWRTSTTGGTAKNRPSVVDFGRQRAIEGEIDRRRSTEGEKWNKKKKRKRRKKKKKRRRIYFPRDVLARALSPPSPAGALRGEKDRGDVGGLVMTPSDPDAKLQI